MALKESGVRLVAAEYEAYIQKLNNINRLHAQVFNEQAGKKAKAGAQQAAQGANMLSGALSKVKTIALAAGAALAAMKVTQFAKDSAMLAARNETLSVVLQQVAKNTGYTSKQSEYAVSMLKQRGITTQAATQSLIQMAQAEIEWADASELARRSQDAAVIANTNSSEAFERMTYAIQTGYSRILRTMGITVNTVMPGPFATEMNLPLMDDPEQYAAFIAKIPMGRWGNLDEIGGVVVFLAGETASFITGAAITVDGGWTAH